jgi:hypothetical protein
VTDPAYVAHDPWIEEEFSPASRLVQRYLTIQGKRMPVVIRKVRRPEGKRFVMPIVPIHEVEAARRLWPDVALPHPAMASETVPWTGPDDDLERAGSWLAGPWGEYATNVDIQCEQLLAEGYDVHFGLLSPRLARDWAARLGVDPGLLEERRKYLDEHCGRWNGPNSAQDAANAWTLRCAWGDAVLAWLRRRETVPEVRKAFEQEIEVARSISTKVFQDLVGAVVRDAEKEGELFVCVEVKDEEDVVWGGGILQFAIDAFVKASPGSHPFGKVLMLNTVYTANLLVEACRAALVHTCVAFWRDYNGTVRSWELSPVGTRGCSALESEQHWGQMMLPDDEPVFFADTTTR